MSGLLDPRLARIKAELSKRKVILVTAAKGGVGKTTLSALLALALSKEKGATLTIDADVSDPNLHVVIGVSPKTWVGEEKGIEPIKLDGLGYIGIVPFTQNKPAPLRGSEAVDAVREMLGALDYRGYENIVIDVPPGLSDVLLDLLNNVVGDNTQILVVSTPSKLSVDSTERYVKLLKDLGFKNVVLIYNDPHGIGKEPGEGLYVPYDPSLENAFGSLQKLEETKAYAKVKAVLRNL